MIDRKKLALIHIVKKELNLTDEAYREILQAAVGVQTAKDLDEVKFRTLMNYFVRSKYYRASPWGLTLKQKIYIKDLSTDLGWDLAHLNHFIFKYYHKEGLEKLTRREGIKLIESLKNVKEHQKANRE